MAAAIVNLTFGYKSSGHTYQQTPTRVVVGVKVFVYGASVPYDPNFNGGSEVAVEVDETLTKQELADIIQGVVDDAATYHSVSIDRTIVTTGIEVL